MSEDDDDEEEDRPLAARTQQPHDTGKKVPQKRAGKKTSGHKTVGGQGPTDQSHQTPIVEAFKNGETNGRKVKKLKPEDVKVNKEQAERLATGVTVDVGVDDATVGFSRPFYSVQMLMIIRNF